MAAVSAHHRAADPAAAPARLAEVPLDTPRTWVEFVDPSESAQRYRCDLTWLTSRYRCVFGAGCPGIEPTRPDDGCCALGAHFTDADDVARVRQVVESLGPTEWQLRDACPGPDDWLEEAAPDEGDPPDAEPELKTALSDGACVLLNRAGFATGAGCALHQYALAHHLEPHAVKPDVCWQLPIRRAYRRVRLPDGERYLEVTLGEYDRRGWGAGGHDLHWYCTGSPLAHTGEQPLFRSAAPELIALMGEEAYEELARHCGAHLAAVARVDGAEADRLTHPATVAARDV